MITIKLPLKYKLNIVRWYVALYYEPNGTDKSQPMLLGKLVWFVGHTNNATPLNKKTNK